MTYEDNYHTALRKLKHDMSNNDTLKDNIERITNCREKVLGKFTPMFSPENIPKLSNEDFKSFFLFSNNCHWRGIHRSRNIISKDMKKLHRDLLYLLDQGKPIDKRVNYIFNNTSGMGKATTTPVLLIAYPKEYGVWNDVSESALKKFGLWPTFERGINPGKKYETINEIFLRFASDLKIDLWTLDAIWEHYK